MVCLFVPIKWLILPDILYSMKLLLTLAVSWGEEGVYVNILTLGNASGCGGHDICRFTLNYHMVKS